MTLTAAQIERYIAAAQAGLGSDSAQEWAAWCTQILRDAITEHPQEAQIPLFLLTSTDESDRT